jgi:hypothetical protein
MHNLSSRGVCLLCKEHISVFYFGYNIRMSLDFVMMEAPRRIPAANLNERIIADALFEVVGRWKRASACYGQVSAQPRIANKCDPTCLVGEPGGFTTSSSPATSTSSDHSG